MDVKLVECGLIDVPKPIALRTFSKDFAVKLADSISTEGQHHAIGVQPSQTTPGRYDLVWGKHRLYSIKTVLKEQFIECKIVTDFDDEDAEMAMISENLWRNHLTKPQHNLSVQKWFKHYLRKHPDMVRSAGVLATPESELAKPEAEEPNAALEATQTDGIPAPKAQKTKKPKVDSFAKQLSAATGQSLTSAKESQQIATRFTEDELECFVQLGTNQYDIATISKIGEAASRSAVVNLIAAGMEPAAAIKEVMGDAAPVPRGESAAGHKEKEKAALAKAPELTDDQWFEEYCGEKAKNFTKPAQYKADAILYRHTLDARHAFRVKVKKQVKATIDRPGARPVMANLLNRMIAMAHPRDWLICEKCSGKGVTRADAGKVCQGCFGAGYKIKLEEYM